jgi:hypothetical protein
MYKAIIRAYDTRQGAVRPNLTWDQLVRIKVPILPKGIMEDFLQRQAGWNNLAVQLEKTERGMFGFVDNLGDAAKQPSHHPRVSKEDEHDAKVALTRLAEVEASPEKVLRGAVLEKRMKGWLS